MKIQADILNGIYEVEFFDSGVAVMQGPDFYEQLIDLDSNRVIATTVSGNLLNQIDTEYGIA